MKKVALIAVLALAAAGLVGAFAVNTYAHPGYGQPCVASGCHAADDPRINTTPSEGVPGLIPTKTVDATCAVTTCDAVGSYRGDAVMHLSASDNADGWGVGYVYYKLDDAPVRLVRVPVDWTAGTGTFACDATVTVPAPGTGAEAHTLKYWTQDNYGNVEAAHTSTFTVAARTVMPMSITANRSSVYVRHPVTISGTVAKPGITVVLYGKRPGTSSYYALKTLVASSTGKWSYTYTPRYRGSWYFKARFAGDSEWLASSSTYRKVVVK